MHANGSLSAIIQFAKYNAGRENFNGLAQTLLDYPFLSKESDDDIGIQQVSTIHGDLRFRSRLGSLQPSCPSLLHLLFLQSAAESCQGRLSSRILLTNERIPAPPLVGLLPIYGSHREFLFLQKNLSYSAPRVHEFYVSEKIHGEFAFTRCTSAAHAAFPRSGTLRRLQVVFAYGKHSCDPTRARCPLLHTTAPG